MKDTRKKTEKIVVFNDESGRIIVRKLVSGVDDPVAAFLRACKKADADGVLVWNYDVPVKYLRAEGVKMTGLDVSILGIERLGENSLPVRLCRCNQCSAYEEGNCFRYGGTVDGFQTGVDCDCIHGTSGCFLTHNGKDVVTVPFETEMEPEAVVEYLKTATEPEVECLKEELNDYLAENFDSDDEADSGWDFRYDD